MKKLFALLVVAGMVAFVACKSGANKEAEQAKLDSIAKADSIRIADSLAQVAADTIKADTVKPAEEVK
ncbi:MAG: hypothetical protein M0R21_11325 [Lentimicrobiaceae bacterium]|jgi:hypothetical protein|nr:hypothetical protein [Lentimicrobiaceae bacterium]